MNEFTTLSRKKVFDSPTRLFHWSFALLFLGAFSIGKFIDDESALFPYHSMLGILMVLAIGLRFIWALMGTRYARFSSFNLNPVELWTYLRRVFTGDKVLTLARNPASSFAAFAMFGLAIALGVSGYLMATATSEGAKHDIKEIHEVMAILFLVIALLHVAGIILHTIKTRDPIGLSMVNGNKAGTNDEVGISRTHPVVGAFYLALLAGGAWALISQYDPQSRALTLAGQTLQLGENEQGEGDQSKGLSEDESKQAQSPEAEEDRTLKADDLKHASASQRQPDSEVEDQKDED